jgi:hypothetical protein
MSKSSRRIFIKSATITGILAPFVTSGFAIENSKDKKSKATNIELDEKNNYLDAIHDELMKEWPKNRTINLVFHGHSVPSGYFKTPNVKQLQSYPFLLLKDLKERYPFAVINIILTCIGGEHSQKGAKRFKNEVLNHKPDVLFIDYALNDTGIGLDASRKAWEYMIKAALKKNIKVILLTATPDQRVDILNSESDLQKHCNQIIELSKEYQTGLVDNYGRFQQLVSSGAKVVDYMSQVNHPNEKGHQLVADGIMKYF